MRSRVGNGRKINLWHDLWLPDPSIFFVTSSPVLGTEHFCVADLVDDRVKHWNIELAGNLLRQFDVEEILKIPCCNYMGDDALVWSLAKDGRFSVRSAYFIIWKLFRTYLNFQFLVTRRSYGNCDIPNKAKQILKDWQKMPPGMVKCNMDAAIFVDQGKFAIGLFLRDDSWSC